MYEEIFSIYQSLSFDIEQLLWLSQDSMNTFEKLISISKQIGTYNLQNPWNIQEINSDINELWKISGKLHDEIIQMEKYSIKSIDILDKNKQTLSNISNSILDLNTHFDNASKSNNQFQQSSKKI